MAIFLLALTVLRYSHFNFHDLENVSQGTFAILPIDGKCMTWYLMAIIKSVLSLTVYEIYAKQI